MWWPNWIIALTKFNVIAIFSCFPLSKALGSAQGTIVLLYRREYIQISTALDSRPVQKESFLFHKWQTNFFFYSKKK